MAAPVRMGRMGPKRSRIPPPNGVRSAPMMHPGSSRQPAAKESIDLPTWAKYGIRYPSASTMA